MPVGSTARSPGPITAACVVDQVGPGVAGQRVGRQRYGRVQPADPDLELGVRLAHQNAARPSGTVTNRPADRTAIGPSGAPIRATPRT